MENNNYSVIVPDTPIYWPDISLHNPDVLDIAIVRTNNLQHNTQIPTSQKPVSLLNLIFFEIIVLNRLKKALKPTIRPEHFGFRQEHSYLFH